MSSFIELHNLSQNLVLNLEDLGHTLVKLVLSPYEDGPVIVIRAYQERRKSFVDVSISALNRELEAFRIQVRNDKAMLISPWHDLKRQTAFSAWLYHSLQENQ